MSNLIKRQRAFIIACLVVPTVLWFYVGLFIMMAIRYPGGLDIDDLQSHLLHFSLIYLLWFVIFFVFNLFEPGALQNRPNRYRSLAGAGLVALAVGVLYFYAQPELVITPRRFLLGHVLITVAFIAVWYELVWYFRSQRIYRAVYSTGPLPEQFHELIKSHSYYGFNYKGELPAIIEESHRIEPIIIFNSKDTLSTEMIQSLYRWRKESATVLLYHDFYELLTRQISLTHLQDIWFIEHIDYSNRRMYQVAKRVIDLIAGLLSFVALVITFPVIFLLIKITSKGSVFFKQERVGQYGKVFILYKYRTMSGGATDTWTANNDSRITSIGKWLRLLRLDELPQAINILKGEMSIVGPRPEQVHIVEQLREQIPYYDERHIVKPGLTGWAQLHVYAASLEETKRKLQYDLYYIKHRSLLFDAEIILKTIYNIISFSGR